MLMRVNAVSCWARALSIGTNKASDRVLLQVDLIYENIAFGIRLYERLSGCRFRSRPSRSASYSRLLSASSSVFILPGRPRILIRSRLCATSKWRGLNPLTDHLDTLSILILAGGSADHRLTIDFAVLLGVTRSNESRYSKCGR